MDDGELRLRLRLRVRPLVLGSRAAAATASTRSAGRPGDEFGGFDSVVLWHAYPRIGADQRNQFDFFRDMPGGLAGVRDAVRQFHARGVKVFLPYNPWDTGTAREKESDDQSLARIVAAVEADGIFLDTMIAAPTGLRRAVDALRPGVAFEPEGHPAIEEMEICSGSWAQGLSELPEIGVLRLKWLEPRHMQHQIRRWDKSHEHELAAAWLNGSGILVWENIFGTWNPWNGEDRATLRRMAPVLRAFSPLLVARRVAPLLPDAGRKGVRLLLARGGRAALDDRQPVRPARSRSPLLEIDDRGEEFYDLWRGRCARSTRSESAARSGCVRRWIASGQSLASQALADEGCDRAAADDRLPDFSEWSGASRHQPRCRSPKRTRTSSRPIRDRAEAALPHVPAGSVPARQGC